MKKLILLGLLFSSTQLIAEPAAIVLFTSNKVVAEHESAERTLSRGAALEAGDAVITSAGALANIKYSNGTLVNIGSDSHYKILAYSPKQSDVQIKAELSYGEINSKTTGKTKEAIKTPVIALAILGTEFELAVRCKKKISEHYREDCDTVNLHVIEGSIMAGGQVFTAGASIQATPSGIKPAVFPPSSEVHPPADAPGTIKAEVSGASNSLISQTAGTVSYTTALNVSTSTGSTAASQSWSLSTGTPTNHPIGP